MCAYSDEFENMTKKYYNSSLFYMFWEFGDDLITFVIMLSIFIYNMISFYFTSIANMMHVTHLLKIFFALSLPYSHYTITLRQRSVG